MNEKFMKELISKDIQINQLLNEANLHSNKIEIIKNHHLTLNQNVQDDKGILIYFLQATINNISLNYYFMLINPPPHRL